MPPPPAALYLAHGRLIDQSAKTRGLFVSPGSPSVVEGVFWASKVESDPETALVALFPIPASGDTSVAGRNPLLANDVKQNRPVRLRRVSAEVTDLHDVTVVRELHAHSDSLGIVRVVGLREQEGEDFDIGALRLARANDLLEHFLVEGLAYDLDDLSPVEDKGIELTSVLPRLPEQLGWLATLE
jgi:hypothetical protein